MPSPGISGFCPLRFYMKSGSPLVSIISIHFSGFHQITDCHSNQWLLEGTIPTSLRLFNEHYYLTSVPTPAQVPWRPEIHPDSPSELFKTAVMCGLQDHLPKPAEAPAASEDVLEMHIIDTV